MFVLQTDVYSVNDLMRTFIEHITNRISETIQMSCDSDDMSPGDTRSVLITGGGALNTFLVDKLKKMITSPNIEIEETDSDTINYKEAMVFAFLGLRCLLSLENVMCNVTGSSSDSVSGNIHLPGVPSLTMPTKMDRFNFQLRRQRSSSFSY